MLSLSSTSPTKSLTMSRNLFLLGLTLLFFVASSSQNTIHASRIRTLSEYPEEYAHCQSDSDCSPNQCCAATPNGPSVCLKYEAMGEQCFFMQRTPSCGCAPGLRCVSTTPYTPGTLGDQYVCAKRRPLRRYKFAPYDDADNEVMRRT